MLLGLALALPPAALMMAQQAGIARSGALSRPEGPCDVYAANGAPCTAAHSSTRALYASYNGPLYQVLRQSDGKTLDVGVVQATATDAGGFADAAAQDVFCANTTCWITTLYDQSGKGNHLTQAPRGGFSGPALGGFNNLPVADMAPITVMGHKAYGVFIEPGMGLRHNDAKGTAVDDQAEGQYWVVSGHHYNGGCCYDYGNAETDSRDDGDGTMETTYFGNATPWYHGSPPGPWIMTDQENNLVGCVTDSPNNKLCADLPIITWHFVAATADGEPHHWRTMGGDAQKGDMQVMFDGTRVQNPNSSYDPMRKQGAILLGNGGDNSNGSQGTFYEGAMTAANTFPTAETNKKLHANIVAAKYDVQRVSIAPAAATAAPPGLQTFAPGSSQDTTVTFTNTTGAPVTGLELSVTVPSGWSSVASGGNEATKKLTDPVAPGASVHATFKVTSGPAAFNGDLLGKASWTANGQTQVATMAEKVRNGSPIKINEFAVGATDSFIELYNAGASEVDISNWTLTQHPTQQAIFSSIKVPAGTKLAGHGFYLLGQSDSGLAVPAHKGDATIYVRSTADMKVGDTIEINTGAAKETHKIATIAENGAAAGPSTTLWQPLPEGPVITIPAGSTNVPYTGGGGGGFGRGGGGGFAVEVGQKIGLGHGTSGPAVSKDTEQYEVVTVTEVGKPGTQTALAANAKAGDTSIRVRNAANISAGDTIRLDIDSVGHGIETITVKSVGAVAGGGGRGGRGGRGGGGGAQLELEAPLKFDHAANIPISVRGTGVTYQPATAFAHSSNEPILPLGTGIKLDSPLAGDHPIDSAVRDVSVKTSGYQGSPAPNQWFGGPALTPTGNMVLRDGAGNVADSLNYGGLVDPWAAEGYQGASPGNGCSVASPGGGGRGGGRRGGPPAAQASRSAGRFPDGADTDSNCRDFLLQTGTFLASDSAAGATNIKVAGVDFHAGQKLMIDTGENQESAVIATVGTAGGSTVGTATEVGATVIPVASAAGFRNGESITIGSDANRETAVVASITGGRGGRRGGGRGGRGGGGGSITITAPLKMAHAEGAEVAGSGITLRAALTKAHEGGATVAGSAPTPGAANEYHRRPE